MLYSFLVLFRKITNNYHDGYVHVTKLNPTMQGNVTCIPMLDLNMHQEFNITIIIIIIVFLLSSNLLMINGITKVNFNLKMSHKLYILQGILGLVNGCIILPLYIVTESLPSESSCFKALATLFGVVYLNLMEIITLVLLSTIRYYAVTSQRNFSGRKVIFIGILTSIVALIECVSLIWSREASNVNASAYLSILFSITYIISQIVVISANSLLLRYVKTIASESGMNGINITYQQRATKTVLILSISFILFTFPSVTTACLSAFIRLRNGEVAFAIKLSMQWTYLLFVLYSGFNAVIFITRTKEITDYYIKIIKRNCICSRSHHLTGVNFNLH